MFVEVISINNMPKYRQDAVAKYHYIEPVILNNNCNSFILNDFIGIILWKHKKSVSFKTKFHQISYVAVNVILKMIL